MFAVATAPWGVRKWTKHFGMGMPCADAVFSSRSDGRKGAASSAPPIPFKKRRRLDVRT
jgi:hypothetical protein